MGGMGSRAQMLSIIRILPILPIVHGLEIVEQLVDVAIKNKNGSWNALGL
jgi:hypothetical protein